MKKFYLKRFLYGAVALCLGACSMLPQEARQWGSPPTVIAPAGESPPVTPTSYMRLYEAPRHPRLVGRVNANFSSGMMTLRNALELALPFPISLVAQDDGVDLTQSVAVRAQNIAVWEYLKQVEGMTDYQIRPNDDVSVLKISSVITRSWNLAVLAGMGRFKTRLGFEADEDDASLGENSNSFQSSHTMSVHKEHEDEVWDAVVAHAQCVIGSGGCAKSRSGGSDGVPVVDTRSGENVRSRASGTTNAWIVENRRMGTITATGSPQKIARLDKWLRALAKDSERLVHLECAILDIVVNDDQAFGVELSALFRDGDFSGSLGFQPDGIPSANGGLLVGAGFGDRHFDLTALIRNLSRVADVRVQNRVRLAVTNGATAYLNTGEVFSYISDVDTSINEVGTTTAYQQSRLQVGLELAVTPRFLSSGDRMMVEVTPILSTLLRFDELGAGAARLRTPVIALRQMSSQAVTSSGRPIAIGGLESDRLARGKSGVLMPKFLDNLFSSREDASQARQLLIIVTPWEVT